jgi:hypothetical protein
MVDILLDNHGDIELNNGKISFTNSKEQTVRIRLNTMRGEYFLDINRGVPYFTEIFNKRNKKEKIDLILKNEISKIKDFVKFDYFKSSINEKLYEYKAKIQFKNKETIEIETEL